MSVHNSFSNIALCIWCNSYCLLQALLNFFVTVILFRHDSSNVSLWCVLFQVHFTISQLAVSGIKVNRLDMYGEVLVLTCFFSFHVTMSICTYDKST